MILFGDFLILTYFYRNQQYCKVTSVQSRRSSTTPRETFSFPAPKITLHAYGTLTMVKGQQWFQYLFNRFLYIFCVVSTSFCYILAFIENIIISNCKTLNDYITLSQFLSFLLVASLFILRPFYNLISIQQQTLPSVSGNNELFFQ